MNFQFSQVDFEHGKPVRLNSLASNDTRLVAVGDQGVILTSDDGTHWKSVKSGTYFELRSVIWTGQQFVVVGGSVDECVLLTSTTGVDWIICTPTHRSHDPDKYDKQGLPRRGFRGVAFTGKLFVSVGYDGTIVTSADAYNWTLRSALQTVYGTASPCRSTLHSVVWTGSHLIAVGDKGTILRSADGVNWTEQQAGTDECLRTVIWMGSQVIAVGGGFKFPRAGIILTSSDGVIWEAKSDNRWSPLESVAWTGSQLIAVGKGVFLTSLDGENWAMPVSGASQFIRAVFWAGTKIVAICDGGDILTFPRGSIPSSVTIPKPAEEPPLTITVPFGPPCCQSTAPLVIQFEYNPSKKAHAESVDFTCRFCKTLFSKITRRDGGLVWFLPAGTWYRSCKCEKCDTPGSAFRGDYNSSSDEDVSWTICKKCKIRTPP